MVTYHVESSSLREWQDGKRNKQMRVLSWLFGLAVAALMISLAILHGPWVLAWYPAVLLFSVIAILWIRTPRS